MITPRATRLVRVSSLRVARRAIIALASSADLATVRRTAVLLPTRAAAEYLRRGFEADVLSRPVILPHLFTRDDWFRWLVHHVPDAPPSLPPHDREAILASAARAVAAQDAPPPFQLRPTLIGEMLTFYDTVRRQLRTVDDFARLADGRFERDATVDLGAARMLAQARFMAASFREYERRLAEIGGGDEHLMRERLLRRSDAPLDRVVVALGDRAADPHGLWLADYDLLARIDGLGAIEIVCTDAALAAGLLQRLRSHLPGLAEERFDADSAETDARPVLVTPSHDPSVLVHRHRDREEELTWVARRIKADVRRGATQTLNRTAVVYTRTLPYVYLAARTFAGAGVPYETVDALPLASEPAAAALDLVIDVVATACARPAVLALLRSPHLAIPAGEAPPLDGFELAALDRDLSERRYLGDPAVLRALAEAWRSAATGGDTPATRVRALARAGEALLRVVDAVGPLAADASPSAHIDALRGVLTQFAAPPPAGDEARGRHLRAQAAITSTLVAVGNACRLHDDTPRSFDETAAALLRWIERQTFSPRRGSAGISLADASAARFGDFDVVYLAGVTQRDWAGAGGRNIFFPTSMLKDLGWPEEADVRAAERATFAEVAGLARLETLVSTFTLEDDALVEPSPLLDELSELGLIVRRDAGAPLPRVLAAEALADGADVVPAAADAAAWLSLRRRRSPAGHARFHGVTRRPDIQSYKVSALDRYVECPFVFFAEQVLRLREEPEDEEGLSPRVQGRLLHEVFEAFFRAWQQDDHGTIHPGNLPEARRVFAAVLDARLASLGEGDAAIERVRFLGSPVAAGLGDVVLGLEAERSGGVIERLLEFPLTGDAVLRTPAGPVRVSLRAVADRIDLLADGSFRVYDYKLTKAPDPKTAVQLPAYVAAARERLAGRHGRTWTPSDAAYVAFGSRPYYRPLAAHPAKLDEVLTDGEARVADAIAAIERGDFPPRPRHRHRCSYCAYAAVCRKDYADGD